MMKNVPKECYTEEQIKNSIYIGPKTHNGMLKCVSDAFKQQLLKFINL